MRSSIIIIIGLCALSISAYAQNADQETLMLNFYGKELSSDDSISVTNVKSSKGNQFDLFLKDNKKGQIVWKGYLKNNEGEIINEFDNTTDKSEIRNALKTAGDFYTFEIEVIEIVSNQKQYNYRTSNYHNGKKRPEKFILHITR